MTYGVVLLLGVLCAGQGANCLGVEPCDGKAAAIALTFAVLAVLVATPSRSGWIGQWQGVGLLLLYTSYLTFTLA